MTPDKVKLAVCVPSAGKWEADFGISLVNMMCYIAFSPFAEGQNREVILLDKRTSLLPRSRQECLEDAIHQDCTHAVFLDTDQVFPPDTIHRLMKWAKPVMACNIALKIHPSFPTARARGATIAGTPIASHDVDGIEKVWRVGSGIMLIDLAVVKPLPKPWFEVRWNKEASQYVGEDWFFCEQLEKAGVDIHIDHTLSRQIGHIGTFSFQHIHIPVLDLESRLAA